MTPITLFATAAKPPLNLNFSDSLLMSLLGMGIVFLALIAIMTLIKIQAVVVKKLKPTQETASATVAIEALRKDTRVPAPGSLGELNLHSVPDKTAALLMAVVADELKTPLNELRFISIKEV